MPLGAYVGLVLDWQKKLGYRADPFEPLTPSPVKRFIVGVEELQERINLFLIKDERVAIVIGGPGTGKTTFLLWMNEELAPQKTHSQHYIDAKGQSRETIANTLLTSRLTFMERVTKAPLKLPKESRENLLLQRLAQEKRNVLLIDNAGDLDDDALRLFNDIAAKTPTHVIFAGTEEDFKQLDLIGDLQPKLKLKIPSYRDDQLFDLLKRRIEAAGSKDTFPFDNQELDRLFKKAERNPAELLKAARERAIELSLKVTSLPKAEAQPAKFLSIKVQKQEAQALKPAPKQPPREEIAEDAAALNQIVSTPVAEQKPAPEPEEVNLAPEISKVVAAIRKTPQKRRPVAIMEKSPERSSSRKKTKHDKVVEQIVHPGTKRSHSKKKR